MLPVLNHINLTVKDVAATAAFFEKYFAFCCKEIKGDNALAILQGEANFTLVLMADTFNRNGNSNYPDAFHIGFLVSTAAEVDALFALLKDDGFIKDKAPANMRGIYGFYFNAPGDILIEVSSTR